MTTEQTDIVILRDGDGNFYVISAEAVRSSRVPAEKAEQLQQALSSDVSGFAFNFFSPNIAAVLQSQAQTNNITGANVLVGAAAAFNNQQLTQTGINIGSQSANVTQL